MTKKYLNTQNEISAFWNTQKIFKNQLTIEKDRKVLFYDGPNCKWPSHAGHVLGRVIKDLVARLKLCKVLCRKKAGWDTHGLPVELEVEKNWN